MSFDPDSGRGSLASGGKTVEYGIGLDELRKLMDYRGEEASEKIAEKFGGAEGLCRRMQTDPSRGLPNDADELHLQRRRTAFGANRIPPHPPKSFLTLVWEALQDLTLIFLLATSLVSLALSFNNSPVGETGQFDHASEEHKAARAEYATILMSTVVLVLVIALNEYAKERQFRAANFNLDDYNGERQPAVTKKKGPSVLKAKLTKLATLIGSVGTFFVLCTLHVFIANFVILYYALNGRPVLFADIQCFLKYYIFGVTFLVVAVPEDLPLAVSLSLAHSLKRMRRDNILVRHSDACETMGYATSICWDMAGALSTDSSRGVAAVQSYLNDVLYKETPNWEWLDEKTRDLLVHCISINSSYSSQVMPPKQAGEQMQQVGNETECGLLGLVLGLGQSYQTIRDEHPEESIFKVYTFNSVRKSMSTVVEMKDPISGETIGYRVFSTGASEMTLGRCKWILGPNGQLNPFSAEEMDRTVREEIEPMTSDGLRTMCLAYKDYLLADTNDKDNWTEQDWDWDVYADDTNNKSNWAEQNQQVVKAGDIDWDDEESIVGELTVIAIIGMRDTLRPEVPEAIAKCQRAGIVVRLVTGDNINTARSIATSCGILKPDDGYLALGGGEFNERIRDEEGEVSQKEMDRVWPRLRVLARAEAQDKLNLVRGIVDSKVKASSGEVVAVTGHGANDGPTLKLKKANVIFLMGNAGTDVAKDASDIILADGNFTSIVKAVMWGRNVHHSVAKLVQFQLTVILVTMVIAFMSALGIQEMPLKAVQMLWIRLIMVSLASLALVTEMPNEDLLKRKPYRKTSPLISPTILKNIIGQAVYQIIVLFTLIFAGHRIFGIDSGLGASLHAPPSKHFTIVFNTFVLMTLFNQINARKIHGERNVFAGLFANPIFCATWVATFLLQFVIVQYGGHWFSTSALTLEQWRWCLALGVGSLFWAQVVTTIPAEGLLIVGCAVQQPDTADTLTEDEDDEFSEKRSDQNQWIRELDCLQSQKMESRTNKLNLHPLSTNHLVNSLREENEKLRMRLKIVDLEMELVKSEKKLAQIDIAKLIDELDVKVNIQNLLFSAIKGGNVDRVEWLLRVCANSKMISSVIDSACDCWTPLTLAANKGNARLVELLLENGANANGGDWRETALQNAGSLSDTGTQ